VHINSFKMSNLPAYIRYREYVGSFWGLYLVGITSIRDLKYSISQLAFSITIEFAITYYTNQLIISKEVSAYWMAILIVICCSGKIVRSIGSYLFERGIQAERLGISTRIGTYVNDLYANATYSWKLKNPNSAQKESLCDIFYAYDNVTSMLSYASQNAIDAITLVFISFIMDTSIGLVTISGTYLLFKIQKQLNKEVGELDKQMGSKMTTVHLYRSNQFTNRADILHTPTYRALFNSDKYDPIIGLTRSCKIWDDRNLLSLYSKSAIDIIRATIILVLCVYLWYINKINLIVFTIVNNSRMFGSIDVMFTLEEAKNISGGRLSTSFSMIDSLFNQHTDQAKHSIREAILKTLKYINNTIYRYATLLNRRKGDNVMVDHMGYKHHDYKHQDCKHQDYKHQDYMHQDHRVHQLERIQINGINRKITETLSLVYEGLIDINVRERGIILLDGKKGCGKSITMDVLAGLYDDTVSRGVYIDGHRVHNEFRGMQDCRTYVRQCVVDDYKSNKKNTVTMALSELFPHSSSYQEVHNFLVNFDMVHKIPKDLSTPISENERGLSPGETQSLILASQLWKASKLESPLLLLDEPERNIDFDTVKKIFSKVITPYSGTIILITHSNDLKKLIRGSIRQIWSYQPNEGNVLTFTTKVIKC
jgi:ABC-type multidrug transport system fused ATPase/permease subunit